MVFKYSYSIRIICKQIYLTHRWDSNRYYHFWIIVDLVVIAIKVFSTLSKTGASPSDPVLFLFWPPLFFFLLVNITPLRENSVSLFLALIPCVVYQYVFLYNHPVGCRIHRLRLCREIRPYFPTCFSRYDTKQSDGEVPVKAGALGNAEYPFIGIALRPTHARNGSIWDGPIYGLNRTNCILMLIWIVLN